MPLPNTRIYLLHGIKIDQNYENTIRFTKQADQVNYFLSSAHLVKSYLDTQYQREGIDVVRVPDVADNLYNVNYMMFQNTSYGNKWFFAFVTRVEYVNDNMSKLHYKIDIMQSWFMFGAEFEPCFIERMHSPKDLLYENLVPESFSPKRYVEADAYTTTRCTPDIYVVAATYESDPNGGAMVDAYGGIYGGIMSGLTYSRFQTVNGLTNFIRLSGTKRSGIVGIFMMSNDFWSGQNTTSPKSYQQTRPKRTTTPYTSYSPRNRKMYTYPYMYLRVSNLNGQDIVYQYEYFVASECKFTLIGDVSMTPSVALIPVGYRGNTDGILNYDEKIVITGYPQIAYTTDTFNSWLSQSYSQIGMAAISTAASIGTGFVAGGAAGAAVSGAASLISNTAKIISDGINAYVEPDKPHGSVSGTLRAVSNMFEFKFFDTYITEEEMRRMDDFWDYFGYPVNAIGDINIDSRPHWNYIKTVGAGIYGDMPQDVLEQIRQIFDSGITFWHQGDNVGNYKLDNRPAGGREAEQSEQEDQTGSEADADGDRAL